MTPIKNCNIFNLLARVPNYDVIIFISFILFQDQDKDHILNHKINLH
jgi:hypothetical protein